MKYKQRKSAKTTSVAESTNIAMKKHRKVKRWQCVTGVLAVVVLLCATYTMILPALTMEQQAYCGQEEHVHTDACYEQRLICGQEEQHTHKEECYADVETCVCGQEETEGHTHSEECYAEDGTCVCGVEETAGHTHDEACYLVQKELVCTVPVGDASHTHTDNCYEKVLVCDKEEHTHNLMCYSNPEADVESQTVWDRSVNNVDLTGIWADDLVAIAESQLGYTESANNYILEESGNIKGYSRYGAWYGDAYGDWCAMFASFCLNYAEIPSVDMPYEASCVRWIKKLSELDMYEAADSYVPQKGDLIFFSSKENGTRADHVGIVSEIIMDEEETLVKLHVIEGDSENSVTERTYELNDSHILGYGKLPENPENMQLVVAAEAQETPPLADIDLSVLTPEELTALLEQITPEDLQAYLESLSDDEYDELMDKLSEEAQAILAAFLVGEQNTLANTFYIGFSKLTTGLDSFEFARLEGGVGVRKFYLASEAVYDQYTNMTNPTYADQEKLIATSELAYCFNYYKDPPTNTFNQSKRSEYYENENSSASLFYNATSSHVRIKDANELYEKILSVALNGYPNDYSGIQAKYGLSDDVFRAITQYAVWYYTDSISIYTYNHTNYYMYADDTGVWLTKNNGVNTAIPFTDSNWLNAYVELRNSSLDSSTVSTSHINLFKNTTGAYQHLLTVGQEDAPPPQQAPNRLRLTKTVSGSSGNTEKLFRFTIYLMDNSFSALSGTYTVISESIEGVDAPNLSSITLSSGTATVSLKHGQSITIDGLPSGFYYSISEAEWNQDGYTSSVTTGTSGNMNSSGGTGAVEVVFTNHKDAPPPSTTYEAKIEATKTLDREVPADGQFTFILKSTDGEEVARKTNNGEGKITFPLTFDAPGTYTYTIEEFNDGQKGIVYDTEVKTVTVTVGSKSLQEIVDGNSFVGSHVSDDFYITVNGTTQLDVYCIDGSAGYPGGTYDKVLNPTTGQLEEQVTLNNYGNELAANMRKLLYYFDTHSYTDKIGYTTLTKLYRQELIWCLAGNSGQQHWTYTDNLSTILAESNPPSDYAVVMFASTGNAQPVIAGYLPATEVVYSGEAGTAEFENYHEYVLPETGGVDTTGYAIGGLLLMSGALLLMCKTKLARKKEGKC